MNHGGGSRESEGQVFDDLIPLSPNKKFSTKDKSFFVVYSLGINSNRDNWVYNYSTEELSKNMSYTIGVYNEEVEKYKEFAKSHSEKESVSSLCTDESKISWSSSLIPKLQKGIKTDFNSKSIVPKIRN